MKTRITDQELDLYHGGRAAYLASLEQALKALIETAPVDDPDDAFAAMFGHQDTAADHRSKVISQYRATIAANKIN